MVLVLDRGEGDVCHRGVSYACIMHYAVQGQGETGKALDK